jgi:hypothetical protein
MSALALAAVLTTAAHAIHFPLPDGFHRFAPRAEGLSWEPCALEGGPTRECSRFEVPLDWNNSAAGKASLAVARYPATKQPRLGTLFINPGGPG